MAVTGGVTEAYKDGGLVLTCAAAGAITAGNVVALTGNMVSGFPEVDVAGASNLALKGVALRTTSVAGDLFAVAFPGCQVYRLKAAGALNAGDYVRTGAAGTVTAIAADGDPRLIFGYALEDVADTAFGKVIVR